VDEWIGRFAEALGEEPLSPAEVGTILKLAREVAHGVERSLAPLASFVAGLHAGRLTAAGGSRQGALDQAASAARALLPEPS